MAFVERSGFKILTNLRPIQTLRPDAHLAGMVFSSSIFLFGFLPLVLLGYLWAGPRGRDALLLFASLCFYAWGEPVFVAVLIVSVACNHGLGRLLHRRPEATGLFWMGIAGNLLPLVIFKYGPFLYTNLVQTLGGLGIDLNPAPAWVQHFPALPIGISFYTFQAISYLTDIKRRVTTPAANPIQFGMYLAMFPQLIAGPIVRFTDIREQIEQRQIGWDHFHSGVSRFVLGLTRKVLIADPLALAADAVFASPTAELSPGLAWLALAAYTLQIYHDFAGYSDMAIGIGRMLGFRFPENFDRPYTARSLREFWQRWHLTLSRWFRDYLYIPLGGNRVAPPRVALNLLTVFFLCGLWHGASWNFVVWGLFHGAFLALERTPFGLGLARLPRFAQHTYTLLIVMIGWVFFRADSLPHALDYLTLLAGWGSTETPALSVFTLAGRGTLAAFIIGATAAVIPANLTTRIRNSGMGDVGILLLLLLCLLTVMSGAYSPFLYFRF